MFLSIFPNRLYRLLVTFTFGPTYIVYIFYNIIYYILFSNISLPYCASPYRQKPNSVKISIKYNLLYHVVTQFLGVFGSFRQWCNSCGIVSGGRGGG